MTVPKILLTDCWTRKTVSAVRSLGKEGIEVHVISGTLLAPAIYSEYVKKRYVFPFPEDHPEKFKEKIFDLIRKEKFDCVMPMDEAASEILRSDRKEVENILLFLLPQLKHIISPTINGKHYRLHKRLVFLYQKVL